MASLVADYDSDDNGGTDDAAAVGDVAGAARAALATRAAELVPAERPDAKRRRTDDDTGGVWGPGSDAAPALSAVAGGVVGAVDSTAGAASSRRLLGARFAAHALFHRSTAAPAAARVDGGGTWDGAGACSSAGGAWDGGSVSAVGTADESWRADVRAPALRGDGDWATAGPVRPSPHGVGAYPASAVPASVLPHLDRAARRGLGVTSTGAADRVSDDAAYGGAAWGAYPGGVGGDDAGADADPASGPGVIEISGASLRGTWAPPAASAGAATAGHKPAYLASKVWLPGAGEAVTTADATSSQKRKNQIGVVAAKALGAAALAAEGRAAGSRTKSGTAAKYGW